MAISECRSRDLWHFKHGLGTVRNTLRHSVADSRQRPEFRPEGVSCGGIRTDLFVARNTYRAMEKQSLELQRHVQIVPLACIPNASLCENCVFRQAELFQRHCIATLCGIGLPIFVRRTPGELPMVQN